MAPDRQPAPSRTAGPLIELSRPDRQRSATDHHRRRHAGTPLQLPRRCRRGGGGCDAPGITPRLVAMRATRVTLKRALWQITEKSFEKAARECATVIARRATSKTAASRHSRRKSTCRGEPLLMQRRDTALFMVIPAPLGVAGAFYWPRLGSGGVSCRGRCLYPCYATILRYKVYSSLCTWSRYAVSSPRLALITRHRCRESSVTRLKGDCFLPVTQFSAMRKAMQVIFGKRDRIAVHKAGAS